MGRADARGRARVCEARTPTMLRMPYPEPTLYAIPFFLVTLALEPWLLARLQRRGRTLRGYERRDTWASLEMGIGSLFFVSLINLGIYAIASVLWRHRLLDLGHGALGWAAALVGWDLAYYWNHRVEHENRVLWACHVNHHSSRLFNLSTALRQPWTPFSGWVFYPGLALLGIAPEMIMVSAGINLVYQYWVHTETVDRLPRWFEAVFNTPSHHRVHHGSNPEYLDKNYGGILIVWDRLFGSFTPESAPVEYGLTNNIDTFSLWKIAFHEYGALGRDLRKATSWRERVEILTHGPAWHRPGAGASSPHDPSVRASIP
jgi:sterol desaturase/sphingolipid hydroxylase (fatty acid hydroxylase superfamily)